jgi:hypothetical protein
MGQKSKKSQSSLPEEPKNYKLVFLQYKVIEVPFG